MKKHLVLIPYSCCGATVQYNGPNRAQNAAAAAAAATAVKLKQGAMRRPINSEHLSLVDC